MNPGDASEAVDLESLKRAAERAIRDAFPVAEPPDAGQVQNDHCPECRETTARFAGKRWSEIEVRDLIGNPGPGLLTPMAFRYYLPAMMLRSLEDSRALDCFPASLIGVLSPAGGKPGPHDSDRLTGFTRDQVLAIVAFLRLFEGFEKAAPSATVAPARIIARALKYWNGMIGAER